ncbi:cell wall metabolism sensor histidine kinase WalK [Paenibacillus aurantius]|uniref:histidine kinase n=1 Tax=Paenibacillus aurantius TaxID=2918900 RepID=A0AA96LHD8_9BACL|nr:cell wall metabolism sensor histidine kinase WalK [Paenibacillus aurantius]WNQ11477.1 cell wall metabolism sensor histidine kinase WalK [Paenibacillus aurantius]
MKATRFFRTIQMKLIIIYVLLILFAMQLIGIYFMKTMENSFMTTFSDSLNMQAGLLAERVAAQYADSEQEPKTGDTKVPDSKRLNDSISELVVAWSKFGNADLGIQVVDANGTVISTNQPDSAKILNTKNNTSIVMRALQNIREEQIFIDTDGQRKKAVAMPVTSGDKVVYAVYITKPLKDVYSTINRVNGIFISGTVIALALTALLGIFLSHTITSPIKEITKQVTSVAEGNYDQRVRLYSQDEIGQLSNAFNYMTDRLKEALSSNEEEKEKLESVLANMSDGVIATDDVGRIILINYRARKILDVEEKKAFGRDLADLLNLPPELKNAHVHDKEQVTLLEFDRPEEEPRKVRVTFTPIHRRDIGTTGTIVVLQDVTEQEELEQARREFVANVSHELRTPLTTIKSYLEALEDGALEEPQLAQRFIGVTRNETERMIRLVTDLLHLSRFDSKQAMMSREWTDPAEMLEEVADRFAFQLQQRHIRIRQKVETRLKPVLVDRDKIDQVLDNLVSNSVKYTGDGGWIELTARVKDEKWLQVTVEDNGVGIPKKDLERIFERFYRVDKARSRNMGGTGLGLSIAREIIKAHGGTISLDSEYNKGTKVTFTLPYSPQEGSEPA